MTLTFKLDVGKAKLN